MGPFQVYIFQTDTQEMDTKSDSKSDDPYRPFTSQVQKNILPPPSYDTMFSHQNPKFEEPFPLTSHQPVFPSAPNIPDSEFPGSKITQGQV